jgi:hypothetical protein
MISAHRHGAVVHVHAESNDDADGRDMAAILAAYFEAEQARAFRRLLWTRLATAALVAIVFEGLTRFLSAGTLVAFFALVCGTGFAGGVVNWWAHRRLERLVDKHSATGHEPDRCSDSSA